MIFVSVASYCDALLRQTLSDAITRAKNRNGLVFGVVEQAPAEYRLYPQGDKFRYVGVEPQDSRGACWARSLCMSLYEGEEFFLQIDSHMLFDDGWDETFLKQLEKCPSKKSIISSYPNAFEYEHGIPVRTQVSTGATCHTVKKDFIEDSWTLTFEGEVVEPSMVPGFAVGAGCIFTLGEFVNEIPYDPYLYFEGEEQAVSLRAFTHGWDIFHTPVPLYHLYDTDPNMKYRPKHWDDEQDSGRTKRWWDLDKKAKERLQRLFTKQNLGVYGLGTARTLEEYEIFSGIDYTNRKINDAARKPKI